MAMTGSVPLVVAASRQVSGSQTSGWVYGVIGGIALVAVIYIARRFVIPWWVTGGLNQSKLSPWVPPAVLIVLGVIAIGIGVFMANQTSNCGVVGIGVQCDQKTGVVEAGTVLIWVGAVLLIIGIGTGIRTWFSFLRDIPGVAKPSSRETVRTTEAVLDASAARLNHAIADGGRVAGVEKSGQREIYDGLILSAGEYGLTRELLIFMGDSAGPGQCFPVKVRGNEGGTLGLILLTNDAVALAWGGTHRGPQSARVSLDSIRNIRATEAASGSSDRLSFDAGDGTHFDLEFYPVCSSRIRGYLQIFLTGAVKLS